MSRKFVGMAVAALVASATTARACNTFDAGTAFIDYQTDGVKLRTQAMDGRVIPGDEVRATFSRMDSRVTAAVGHCKRGEVISIPRIFVERYCDFGKHVENEGGGMAASVKR